MKKSSLSMGYFAVILVAFSCSVSQAALVNIYPSQDNSIYNENDNSNALGGLIVGRTAAGGNFSLRRALVQFDIAANIPAGATINSASLDLAQLIRGPSAGADIIELRPVLAAWGEGTSSGAGLGATPTANDATWNYRLFSTNLWTTPGGDFGGVSGTTVLGNTNILYSFSSQAGMVADVQNWLDAPATNFGWLLRLANETPQANARQFGSRESGISSQPVLHVDFTPAAVPEPGTFALIGSVMLATVSYRNRRRQFTN